MNDDFFRRIQMNEKRHRRSYRLSNRSLSNFGDLDFNYVTYGDDGVHTIYLIFQNKSIMRYFEIADCSNEGIQCSSTNTTLSQVSSVLIWRRKIEPNLFLASHINGQSVRTHKNCNDDFVLHSFFLRFSSLSIVSVKTRKSAGNKKTKESIPFTMCSECFYYFFIHNLHKKKIGKQKE
jgi:hypothetical protein